MSKSMKLSAFYEKPELLMKLFGWVSAGVMLFNMVLICCDVFMRYAFNSPIQGTTEIVTMLMAWVAYAGMGYTLLKGQHCSLAPCTTGCTAGSSTSSAFSSTCWPQSCLLS